MYQKSKLDVNYFNIKTPSAKAKPWIKEQIEGGVRLVILGI